MAIISASEFSKLAGVSKAAISKAPDSKIKKTADGKIDTENPVNAIYLAEHNAEKKQPKPAVKKPAERKPVKPMALGKKQDAPAKKAPVKKIEHDELPDTEEPGPEIQETTEQGDDETIGWILQDKMWAARYKKEATEKLALAKMQKKGELIERTQFITAVQGINKAIDDHLHRLPAKLGPVLFAIARQEGGNELAVVRELEKGMGDAIRRAVDDIANLKPTGAATIAP